MKTKFTYLFELYKELFERLLKAEQEREDELNWYLSFNNDNSEEAVIVNIAFLSGSVLYDKHFLLKDIAPEVQEELTKELEKIEQALTSPAIVLTNDDAKILHRTIKEYINLGMTPNYRLIELRDLFNSGKIQATKGFGFNIVVYEQIKSLFENYLDEYFKNLKAEMEAKITAMYEMQAKMMAELQSKIKLYEHELLIMRSDLTAFEYRNGFDS